MSGEYEDPQVAFEGDPSLAESKFTELLEVPLHLRGKEPGIAGDEFAQSLLGAAQASDAGGEVVVDLGEGALECAIRRSLERFDPCERTPASASVRILIRSMASWAV